MTHASVLDLGLDPRFAAEAAPRRVVSPRLVGIAAAALAGLFALGQFVVGGGIGDPARAEATIRISLDQKRALANLTEGKQAEIVVEGQLAQQRNDAIPLSGLPIEQVRAFLLAKSGEAAGGKGYGTALTCLTQAVFYEAGYESAAGKRAVAQVILNRMRHPAYPKSVCGVIYQGSQRRTGCQFSFTCDGSLLRKPAAIAWRDAAEVARAALAGHVEAGVGTATHYHADYVLPRWAFQLAKIDKRGAHIFYRFPGAWGKAGAFSGGYSGVEQIPSIDYEALLARTDGEGALAGDELAAGLSVAPDVTDRHAPGDVGGRINVTKLWRLSIPDPTEASSGYRAAIDDQEVSDGPIPVSNSLASAAPGH